VADGVAAMAEFNMDEIVVVDDPPFVSDFWCFQGCRSPREIEMVGTTTITHNTKVHHHLCFRMKLTTFTQTERLANGSWSINSSDMSFPRDPGGSPTSTEFTETAPSSFSLTTSAIVITDEFCLVTLTPEKFSTGTACPSTLTSLDRTALIDLGFAGSIFRMEAAISSRWTPGSDGPRGSCGPI
jgi:hypothetical protein